MSFFEVRSIANSTSLVYVISKLLPSYPKTLRFQFTPSEPFSVFLSWFEEDKAAKSKYKYVLKQVSIKKVWFTLPSLEKNSTTSWVCRATLEFNYRLGWVSNSDNTHTHTHTHNTHTHNTHTTHTHNT